MTLQIHLFLGQASPSLALVTKTPTDYGWSEQTVGDSYAFVWTQHRGWVKDMLATT